MTSLAPTLLIAVPQLLDPNFRRSVVLLLQQSDEGALGVVVNHETPLLLRDLCRDQSIDYSGDPKKHVRRGGPVQPENGLVLFGPEHVDPADPEDRQVLNGLHVSASRETLHRLCKLPRGRFHCYAGYAGWAPEQLEQEIGAGSWITAISTSPVSEFKKTTIESAAPLTALASSSTGARPATQRPTT